VLVITESFFKIFVDFQIEFAIIRLD